MYFRSANIDDAYYIAKLHAQSWQQNYQQDLSANYLKHQVFDDHLQNWLYRLSKPSPNDFILLIEHAGLICGFICMHKNHHQEFGALIENLHVHPDFKGRGFGTKLIKQAIRWLKKEANSSAFYLEVLDSNINARSFYKALGGTELEAGYWATPCGHQTKERLYYWPSSENFNKSGGFSFNVNLHRHENNSQIAQK